MAHFLATKTLEVSPVIIFPPSFNLVIRVILFTLVLAQPTPGRLLVRLTAAPVHVTTPQTGMDPATPHEVILLRVIFSAPFTLFNSAVELALPLNHLLNAALHLLRLLQ